MRLEKVFVPPPPRPSWDVQRLWKDLQNRYFQCRLPEISIEWSSRLTSSSGMFVSYCGPRDSRLRQEHGRAKARVIRLSSPLLQRKSLSEIRGTLAHEMIHQWQFDIQRCRPSHGPEFYRFMAIMNQDGLRITVCHTMTEEVEALARYVWRCQKCGTGYYRQRRTIFPRRHRCGLCLGPLLEMPVTSRDLSSVSVWSRKIPFVGRHDQKASVGQLIFDFAD